MFDLFLAGLGAAASVSGSLLEGDSKSATYLEKADVLDRQADYEGFKSDYDVARQRDKTRRTVSSQNNYFLGQGLQLTGTPADVAYDSISESEKDVFAIRLGATIRANNYRQEADNDRRLSSDAKTAGILGALTGAAKFGGSGAGQSALKLGASIFGGG